MLTHTYKNYNNIKKKKIRTFCQYYGKVGKYMLTVVSTVFNVCCGNIDDDR